MANSAYGAGLADRVATMPNNNIFGWNVELAALCGSNTAIYHLGTRNGAVAAMFYLVKYILKESGELTDALEVMAKRTPRQRSCESSD